MKIRLNESIRCLILLNVLLASSGALAAICTVTTQSITFGSYDTFSSQNLDSTGAVNISCDSAANYIIALSAGGGTFLQRTLIFTTRLLNYNLFTDAARTVIWGDGSSGTTTVSGTTSTTASHVVYGRIPARQNAFVGNYSDNVTVTITF